MRSRRTALLAHEMGLGKTAAALRAAPPRAPILAAVPGIAIAVWQREAKLWRPDLLVRTVRRRGSFRWPAPGELTLCTYGRLPGRPRHRPAGGTVAIADEAHLVKEPNSTRTTRWRRVARLVYRNAGRVWLVTATPLLNHRNELWEVLQSAGCARQAFGSRMAFDALGDHELAVPLRKVMLRYRLADVLPDLPPLRYEDVQVPIGRRHRAEITRELQRIGVRSRAALRAVLEVLDFDGGKGLAGLSRMRRLFAAAKIPSLLKLVRRYEAAREPLIVFSAHKGPVSVLARRPGWAGITGATSTVARGRLADAFQAGELRGLALTIRAGGHAVTLTRARHVLFVDREWTPALNEQAVRRIYRIGQLLPCLVRYLVADHPIDRRVAAVLAPKRELAVVTGMG